MVSQYTEHLDELNSEYVLYIINQQKAIKYSVGVRRAHRQNLYLFYPCNVCNVNVSSLEAMLLTEECKCINWNEQFTVKAHPALFEGREVSKKMRHLLFQYTVDIHSKMRHCYSNLQLTYTFKTRTKHTQKLRRLALCAFILFIHQQQVLYMKNGLQYLKIS